MFEVANGNYTVSCADWFDQSALDYRGSPPLCLLNSTQSALEPRTKLSLAGDSTLKCWEGWSSGFVCVCVGGKPPGLALCQEPLTVSRPQYWPTRNQHESLGYWPSRTKNIPPWDQRVEVQQAVSSRDWEDQSHLSQSCRIMGWNLAGFWSRLVERADGQTGRSKWGLVPNLPNSAVLFYRSSRCTDPQP